jgi:SAM-dependent methyltransferase
VDVEARRKWDFAGRNYDFLNSAEVRRLGPQKRRLFTKMRGETLFAAAGTGNDFQFFPPGQHFVAIDISPKMLERAAKKAAAYPGKIELREMDVCELPCLRLRRESRVRRWAWMAGGGAHAVGERGGGAFMSLLLPSD